MLCACRSAARRYGLLRRERWQRISLSRANSHRFLYGHEHHRQIEQGDHGRGSDRADRQSRCRCAGDRPLAAVPPIIMQAFIDQLIQGGAFAGVPREVVYAIAMVLTALIVLSVFVAPLAGVTSWLERRVWARMQSRIGPNRVGPQGVLQWLADGIKNLLKEDLIPSAADAKLFSLAPYVVFVGFLCTFVVIPFGGSLIVADLNIGILYLLAVTSLVVVGILMAGGAPKNKGALLG